MNRILKALERMMNGWRQDEENSTVTHTMSSSTLGFPNNPMTSPLQQQAQAAYSNWAMQNTTTTGGFGSLMMGGALSQPGPTYTPTFTQWAQSYKWELTDEQLDRLMTFMDKAMKSSWRCQRCQREYAPLTPDCEVCNVIDRLEGMEKEAV